MVRRTIRRRRSAAGRSLKRRTTRTSRTTTRPRTRRASGRPTRTTRRNTGFKPWTPNEVKMLRQMYRDTPNKEVAKKLGRTISAVQGKAGDLGLRKTATYIKKMRQGWN